MVQTAIAVANAGSQDLTVVCKIAGSLLGRVLPILQACNPRPSKARKQWLTRMQHSEGAGTKHLGMGVRICRLGCWRYAD